MVWLAALQDGLPAIGPLSRLSAHSVRIGSDKSLLESPQVLVQLLIRVRRNWIAIPFLHEYIEESRFLVHAAGNWAEFRLHSLVPGSREARGGAANASNVEARWT